MADNSYAITCPQCDGDGSGYKIKTMLGPLIPITYPQCNGYGEILVDEKTYEEEYKNQNS